MGNLFTESISCTYTTMFLVPSIGIPNDVLKSLGFIDGFLDDLTGNISYENSVYMLFKPQSYEKMYSFVEEQRGSNKHLIDDYDYDGGYVVLVYKIQQRFMADYQLFLESKYSHLSKEFKETIPQMVKIQQMGMTREVYSIPFRAMYKDLRVKMSYDIYRSLGGQLTQLAYLAIRSVIKDLEEGMGITITNDMEILPAVDLSKEVLDIEEIKANTK